MAKQTEKRDGQKLAAGIFTLAMALLCAALYFFTGGAKKADGSAEPPAGTTAGAVGLAPVSAFVEGKDYYTFSKESEKESVYALKTETMEGALTLFGKDGVREFILTLSLPVKPEPLPKNAPPSETLLYKKRQEAYETDKGWIRAEAESLLCALDVENGVSHAEREAFLFALDSTMIDKKLCERKFQGITLRAFCYEDGETPLVITASLGENEAP